MGIRMNHIVKIATLTLLTLAGFILLTTPSAVAAKKMSKKEKAAFASPLPLLTFDQVAKLDKKNRVLYVRQFRQALTEIEKAQFMFRDSLFKGAALQDFKNLQDEVFEFKKGEDVYALLMGDYAFADGARGRLGDDKCIFAYYLSEYENTQSGQRQPFLCKPVERCKDNGSGVRCDPDISGIQRNETRGCIPDVVRYKATSECDSVRNQLNKENAGRIPSQISAADQYFFNREKIKASDMQSEEAVEHLRNLLGSSYNDESYAELIKVLALYKKHGQNLPITGLENQFNSLSVAEFGDKFNKLSVAVNQIFDKHIKHCEYKLDDKEIAYLRDPKWATEAEQRGRAAHVQEKRRIDALAKLDAGVTPTIENVLEIPECFALKSRRDAIYANLDKINGAFPDLSDDTPAAQEPLPGAPASDSDPITTGCSRNIVREEHQLYQPAARCVICLAEKAVEKSASNPSISSAEAENRKYYSASTKWHSLLSTVALACTHGVGSNTHISPDMMLLYQQTFGHCSSDTYDWNPTQEQVSPSDRALLEEWSKRNYWTQLKEDKKSEEKTANPALDKDFQRIYGISYAQATKLFCPEKAVQKTWFLRRVKGVDEEKAALTPADYQQFSMDARKQFVDYRKSIKNASNKQTPADALLKCMDESAQRADELYVQGSGACRATTRINNDFAYSQMFGSMTKKSDDKGKVDYADTNILFNVGACYVAKQVEFRKGDQLPAVGYVSSASQHSDQQYLRTRYYDRAASDKKPEVRLFPSANQIEGDLTVGNIDLVNISYISDVNCPPGAVATSSSSGKSKSQK